MRKLRMALTKGRLERDTVSLFEKMGLPVESIRNKGRRLILPVGDTLEVVLAKPGDVITYVRHGVCDIGVVGKDTIAEAAAESGGFYEMLDLGFGRCRFALAVPRGVDFFSGYAARTVASKYPQVTRSFFDAQQMDVHIIRIDGSVELAPLLGLADGIVDLVETGSTLRENGLEIAREIIPVSARVIVNMACMKLRKSEIEDWIERMEQAL